MKDFLNNLESDAKLFIATLLTILVAIISLVLITNISTTIDLYLLRDNQQAMTLYLNKEK